MTTSATTDSNDFVTVATLFRPATFPPIMDQYHSNTMSANNPPYPGLPVISPQQLQQHHNQSLPQTLPPLQAPGMHLYPHPHSAPHTPRTPNTPNTPGSANTMNSFPQMGPRGGYQMVPTTAYQQPPQQYRTTSSMLPQASTAMSHPQPIAPAPMQNRMPQTLRPMPPNGIQHMQSVMSPYGQPNMMSHPSLLDNLEPPTHVVGSQGRRGILPSAPGRPAVTTTGTGSTKNAMIPAKDADGKFPCPHCTKTYLHAKHLKRHLLRRKCSVLPPSPQLPRPNPTHQTPETAHICACSAATPSRAVTS